MKRSDIAEDYKWDLSSIYKNEDELYKDIEAAKEMVEKTCDLKGHICDSSRNLSNLLQTLTELDKSIERMGNYSSLKLSEDLSDENANELSARVETFIFETIDALSFVDAELLNASFQTVESYIAKETSLRPYRFYLQNLFRQKPHTLDEKMESILTKFSDVAAGYEKSFNYINDVENKFGTIRTPDGKKIELTTSNYKFWMSNSDRKFRKKVYEKIMTEYARKKLSIAEDLIGEYKYENLVAKIRGFKDALRCALFEENIEKRVYMNIVDVAMQNSSVLHDYYGLIKKTLKLPELKTFDLYARLSEGKGKVYEFHEARSIIKDGLKVLGSEYSSILDRAFDERWIDLYHNDGKTSGFFSVVSDVCNPYILANYEGRFYDISALAHELGHSVNTYFKSQNNMHEYSKGSNILSEVASLTNEILLSKYMLSNCDDPDEKVEILSHLLDLYIDNFMYTGKGAKFELELHEMLDRNEPVTADGICELWNNLLKEFYRDDVELCELDRYGWSKIPHFYMNYYYYQYAVGITVADYFAEGIYTNDEKILSDYMKFLCIGSDRYPMDIMAELGIDLNKKETFEKMIESLKRYIEMFNNLLDKE